MTEANETKIAVLQTQMNEVVQSVAEFRSDTKQGFNDLRTDMTRRFDRFEQSLTTLSQNFVTHVEFQLLKTQVEAHRAARTRDQLITVLVATPISFLVGFFFQTILR